MSLIARRPWGALLLAVFLAAPATMVVAAVASPTPSSSASVTSAHAAAAHKKKSATHARRHSRRAPPAGGVYARNALVMDAQTGEVLYAKNADSVVPIASLSKLMTAMVFLEQNPDLEREVEVTRNELDGAGHTRLRNHEQVRLRDLLHMSLMCSDNCATRVVAREGGLSNDDFLVRMNHKAQELGLAHTHFVEPTGLDQRNVSSAEDCARMLRAAASNPVIQDIMTTRIYEFRSASAPHTVVNTNRLLVYGRYDVRGGKTGFINEAGYCFATWVRTQGRDLVAVVLGAPTAATRFADVVRLVQRTTSPTFAPSE
jgi:D-alanyl-D-alanine endopeptidase (penicillin-binding protein 7)